MSLLAYLMLDGPGTPHDQLKLSVFLPSAAIAIAWVLIKRKKSFVTPAVIVAALSGLVVVSEALHPSQRISMIEEFGTSYVFAIALSACFPFLVIAAFYREEGSRANQSIQPNAGSRPSSDDNPESETPSAPAPRG